MKTWKKYYKSAIPIYLARYYWWAYLWKVGVWFFDHQWIINLILFGKYKQLVNRCLQQLLRKPPGRVLQLSCVYGNLTRHLYANLVDDLHIADIADIQLKTTMAKIPAPNNRCYFERMNAEQLGFIDAGFDTVLVFFLFHELPADARARVLSESIRVLKTNGRLLIVEYGELAQRHPFHRFAIFRWILGRLEPFLPEFWREDLRHRIGQTADTLGRHIRSIDTQLLFNGFYRVVEIEFE